MDAAKLLRVSVAAATMVALTGHAAPVPAQQLPAGEAPFGDQVSSRIPNYDRASRVVATAGQLGRLGVIEAKRVGFTAVIDLSPSLEASANERTVAKFALLKYYNLPLTKCRPKSGWPSSRRC